jgi:protein required for attachment to host cells
MKTTWIIAADAARARVFSLSGPEFLEVQDFAHAEGRERAQDLVAEPSGRFYGRGEREQGHSANERTDVIAHENERFARTLADFVEHARTANRFDGLVLIAAPKFLGLLRSVLPAQCEKRIERTVARDVVKLDAAAIREYATGPR